MAIFHCYVSSPKGTFTRSVPQIIVLHCGITATGLVTHMKKFCSPDLICISALQSYEIAQLPSGNDCYIAIENDTFIVDLPIKIIKDGDFPVR